MVKTRSQVQRELMYAEPHSPPPQAGNTSGIQISPETEQLGRGCRVPRPLHSLDEQYLRESYFYAPRSRAAMQRRESEEIIHRRYPPRDAAVRALSSLKDTMNELSEDSTSQQYNFRHHPELKDELRHGRDDDDDDDESDSTSENTSSSNSPSRCAQQKRTFTSQKSAGAESTDTRESHTRGRLNSGYEHRADKRGRSVDSVISISDGSLRHDSESSGSDDSSSYSDESDPLDNSREVFRKASVNAKDSVQRNLPVNHYMNDAIGAVDEQKRKKREIDRRYRHLFVADKKEKKQQSGGGGDPSNGALGDISPLSVDSSITFDSVGGLPQHIVTLREMVLFPLLYPDLLSRFNLQPPRGVLFVGPPGTGKTLMARALANEGSRSMYHKITFFMRKGADILSKWVGESERQLSLLFEEAKAKKPSIIFFDEIDGLAPVRHSKTEQSHAALVATFLALMDGLDDRGQVVVIGATNRPDTIDPALRRPGRFDRELFFPYPNKAARKHVLSIVSAGMLPTANNEKQEENNKELLDNLVGMTEGFSGADLKALCVEAGLNRLRTSLPQLYTTSKKLCIPASTDITVTEEDFFVAARRIRPSLSRSGMSQDMVLEEHWDYLLFHIRQDILCRLQQMWPTARKTLRDESVDCADVRAAVRKLSEFPVPLEKKPFMLLLESLTEDEAGSVLKSTCLSIMKAFPSFRPLVVHMNHIQVDFNFSGNGMQEMAERFSSGHIFELVSLLRQSSPCILLLQGVEDWLTLHLPASSPGDGGSSPDDEGHYSNLVWSNTVKAWSYYMNLLSESEVLILIPCQSKDKVRQFIQLSSEWLHIPWQSVEIPTKPSRDQLGAFVRYMFRIFLASLLCPKGQHVATVLSEDISPPPTSNDRTAIKSEKDEQEALKLWRKVEYRRLQLRHVLSKWIGQYISSGKYKVLHSADLDFGPDDSLLKEWQRHTSGSRIGLNDILEKVESNQYVCLSQYHDDIDMLVHNIRSFFRSKSMFDSRYRLKALDLKENTVLGLYKVNRNLVRFCEEHKYVTEPALSEKDGAGSSGKIPLHFVAKVQRKARSYWGKRRKRRRKSQAAVEAETPIKEELEEESEQIPQEVNMENEEVNKLVHCEANEDVVEEKRDQIPCEMDTDTIMNGIVDRLLICSIQEIHFIYCEVMKQLQELVQRSQQEDTSPLSNGNEVLKTFERCLFHCCPPT